MQLLSFFYPAFFTLLTFAPNPTSAAKKPPSKNAILLSQVRTLTLRSNAKTSHRRVSAIPQLTCKGPGCAHHKIDILRCTNQGSSYGTEDIEWSCSASLPPEFKLGSTDVICEGYSSPDDEYILKGSCGVEYRLLLTDAGEEKYGYSSGWLGSSSKSGTGNEESWTWGSIFFLVAFVGIAAWILYAAYNAAPAIPRQPRQPGNGFWGGWGGGGGGPGGGPPYDPPPPYSRKPYGSEGWRPGFWSGTAAGAAAGYMAGSRGNRQQPPPVIPQTGGGWFGGGSNGDHPRTSPRRSGSSSSARYESTGFGSTSRR